jgi:hypothetical protein
VAAENLTTAQSPHAETERSFYYERIYYFVETGFIILASDCAEIFAAGV